MYTVPSKKEVNIIKAEYNKKPTVKLLDPKTVFVDPMFEQALPKIPVNWCMVNGYFEISAEMEDDQPIVTFAYNDSHGEKNFIKLGLENIKDLEKFMQHTEVHSVVNLEKSKFDLNFKNFVKTTSVVVTISTIINMLMFWKNKKREK